MPESPQCACCYTRSRPVTGVEQYSRDGIALGVINLCAECIETYKKRQVYESEILDYLFDRG